METFWWYKEVQYCGKEEIYQLRKVGHTGWKKRTNDLYNWFNNKEEAKKLNRLVRQGD